MLNLGTAISAAASYLNVPFMRWRVADDDDDATVVSPPRDSRYHPGCESFVDAVALGGVSA